MNKNLLIFFFGLLGLNISAQSLQITGASSNVIANGTIVDLWCDMNATAPYEDFKVNNISSSSKFIKCKRYEIFLVPGTSNLLCWTYCYPPSVSVGNAINVNPANYQTLTSHYYPNGFAGTTILDYTFWDSLNPADSAWMTVRWNATPAGINPHVQASGFISNIYPNPANSSTTINYQLYKTDNAMIRIYNVVGSEVKRIRITSMDLSTTFSVGDLEPGIYFCSFVANDKILATRKLTINR